jgi:tripeptide aminopeptidase
LPQLAGGTLITTDGKTLLGADDKAGVAEIMTFAEQVLASDRPHGKICIAFTPDEEIGQGADAFDVARFGAQFAFTVDGGAEGEIEFENFNAAGAKFIIHGVNVHPGSAKDMMKNAALIGCELQNLLPADEIPAKTEGYEGFYHLTDMEGNVEKCTLSYIIRDHDANQYEKRLAVLREVADAINAKYGEGTVGLTVREQYRNMAEKIKPCYHLIENALAAAKDVGIEPKLVPIRGGTDGARLSFMGLPCPNLGTGGYAFHGPFEHITAEGMDAVVAMLHAIVACYAK